MAALTADAGQHAVNSFLCCGELYFNDAGHIPVSVPFAY